MDLNFISDKAAYEGWTVGGAHVPPVYAYVDPKSWFDSFLHQFPKKAQRMREYDKKRGFTNVVFYRRWVPVVIAWLDKQGARNGTS